jgi:uncharacterized protein (TIRG00374 family)
LAQDSGIASRSKRRALIIIAALATLIYLGTAFAVDSARLLAAVEQLDWVGCGLVLALSLANYLIRFQRWQVFVARLGHVLPFGRHLLYYLSGFAFTVSPAKAGEAVRSLYLRGYGVTYSQSMAALFVERLQDLLAMTLLASLVVLDRPAYRPLVGGALLLVIALVIAASRNPLPALLERLSRALSRRRRVAALLAAMATLLRSSRSLLQPRLLLLGTAVGIVSWGAEGLGYYLICRGLHIDVSLLVAVGIYALAVLAGSAAFFLPAGLGGMELVMTTLLVAQGASLSGSLVATLLCRVATLWFAVVIGMSAAAVVEMGPDRARLESVQ